MNKDKEKQLDMIWEAITMEVSIQCQVCNKTEKDININDYNFAEKLYKNGWGLKDNTVLCNKCILK